MRTTILLLFLITATASAQSAKFRKSTIISYPVPDTVKAAQWYAEISVTDASNGFYSSCFSKESLGLYKKGKRKTVIFTLDSISPNTTLIATGLARNTTLIATGLETTRIGRQSVSWKYNWKQNTKYKLLITTLADSASHASFYTGYLFLPEKSQWKLIASFKTTDRAQYLNAPSIKVSGKKSIPIGNRMAVQDAWIQRSNGTWKNLRNTDTKSPVFSVTNHLDSTAQAAIDKLEIIDSKTDTTGSFGTVFYYMIQAGKGKLVKLTDTVSVYYKGWLLKDGTIFDQTKDKPAKFPLARLIKGWQLGLVNCRVGGKIRMIIPSGLAYSIRSRSKDIPPNSVLVFEVEVLEAKAAG
ncbi:MAG: FKBP-type peptidyl-prolyl cis-trans isomerase [Chitinophagaceae bacterium]